MRSSLLAIAIAFGWCISMTTAEELASERPVGRLEVVATLDGPMPTGVTVSRTGRIFLCYPRWGDDVAFTVGELKKSQAVAYPNETINQPTDFARADRLISVQSVVVDPLDRLWLVDTGSIEFGPTSPGGPKLVCVDLQKNEVVKTITFPSNVGRDQTALHGFRRYRVES